MDIVVNCIEWHSMKFIQKVIKKAFFCPCKTHFITPSPCTPVKNVFLLLLLVKISIWNIDCRYIDTFEKYRYRYRYRYGEVENIDIDIDIDRAILKNIDIDIDIDKAIPKISISISISIWWFWKISISISISIRQFCKISISIKYRIDSNLAYRTGLPTTDILLSPQSFVGLSQNQNHYYTWHQCAINDHLY